MVCKPLVTSEFPMATRRNHHADRIPNNECGHRCLIADFRFSGKRECRMRTQPRHLASIGRQLRFDEVGESGCAWWIEVFQDHNDIAIREEAKFAIDAGGASSVPKA